MLGFWAIDQSLALFLVACSRVETTPHTFKFQDKEAAGTDGAIKLGIFLPRNTPNTRKKGQGSFYILTWVDATKERNPRKSWKGRFLVKGAAAVTSSFQDKYRWVMVFPG